MRRNLLIVLAVAIGIVLAELSGAIRPLENWLGDLRMRLTPRAPTGVVVLVDIDAKSIEAIGRWPWSRSIHARLIDALTGLNAAEIAFDIDFSAASTSDQDALMADALARAGGAVILASFQQKLTADSGETRSLYNQPIEPFARNAWAATVNVVPDSDVRIRRFSYGDLIDDHLVPSIPALLGGGLGDVGREFIIDFGIDARAIDRIPVIDLLNGTIERSRIDGKKVIIGAAATELRDVFSVPVHGIVAGSMLQALATESLLQQRALRPVDDTATWLGILFIAALMAVCLRRVRWTMLLAGIGVGMLVIEGGALLLQQYTAYVLDTAPWQASLACFALVALLREIDFRRILLLISRNQTDNTRTILDRVVADNFAGVLVVDEAGIVRAASRSAGKILGIDGDLTGVTASWILPQELTAALAQAILHLKAGTWHETGLAEIEYVRSGKAPAIFEYVVTPSRMSGGVTEEGRALPDRYVACVTFGDVTEKRQAAARIAHMARFDLLTGLANRNQFLERLDQVLLSNRLASQRTAVLCFDLDRFKNVNDTLGHNFGDLLLRAVAERVRALTRTEDLVARFGGDEYAVVIAGSDAGERAVVLAERLIARVSEPYHIEGHRLIIGISIGIALGSDGESDPATILKHADTALYRAKATGGNAYAIFAPDMLAGLRERQHLELELWEAFEKGQFEVFFQPQVDLRDGRMVGVEALLRWRHPTRGFIPPAEFIPVAEAVGLISPLGEWTLIHAATEVVRWNVPLKLAVNVSSIQFARGNLVGAVTRALRESGLPPGQLELEITESVFMDENRVVEATLGEIRALGVGFALDDFGTGYSSLNYIRKFPVDKIKIDQSFVAAIPIDQDSVAIVRAVAALAQSLDIRLNAEGIENVEQVHLLRLLGCNEGQGYLFGRPQPAEGIVKMLNAAPLATNLVGQPESQSVIR